MTGSDEKRAGKADDEEFHYGWFGKRPACCQAFLGATWLLVFMSVANVFQSMTINGLVGTVLTSLEERFDLSSNQSAWIVSSYDVSTVPILILVSYFGSSSHRPRWTAIGLFILVIGAVIFVIPHFATGVYEIGQGTGDNLCRERPGNESLCYDVEEESDLSDYLVLFILGRLFHGLGAVPLYTICVTFMDDVVSKETFSLYIAIFYSAGILGPALGYIVGGYLLTVYTDFYSDYDPGIDSGDPQWVGAWWPGFLVGAFFLFITAVPLSGYPRDFPGAAEIRANKVSEAYNVDEEDINMQEMAMSWRDLPGHFRSLLTNPTYVLLSFFVCTDSLLTGGFAAFGPKYVQDQFSASAAYAGILFGIVVIPGGAGGTVIGGILVKKFKMTCTTIMKWETIFNLVIIACAFGFFIVCDPIQFVGVNHDGSGISGGVNASCQLGCMCDDFVSYTPVCGVDDLQYFSPCHAGCLDRVEVETGIYEFFNCTCINGTVPGVPDAKQETCSNPSCTLAPLFMVVLFVGMFLMFACSSMNITATVRCVPAQQRSLAIGIQWIMLRLLGTVPGPLIFGAAFDTACTEWGEECGRQTSCLLYDHDDIALHHFLIVFCVKTASLFMILGAWKLYKPPKKDTVHMGADFSIGQQTTESGIENGGIVSPVFEPDTPNGNVDTAQKTYL